MMKIKLKTLNTMILFTGIIALFSSVQAQEVEFNYNGRVNVQGAAFSGTGQFKFSLVNKTGTITHWANDDITLDGTEPTTSITSTVNNGFFSVDIGDTSIANMAELDASLFNVTDKILLRSWFDDGVNGFERLFPDRKVVNPALLGSQSLTALDIYVDPVTGDDTFTGLKPNRPKKTIQSAWDSLPVSIKTTATIHLVDGVYREQVLLEGKQVSGSETVVIRGNITTPSLVRVTGADASATTTAVRDYGFLSDNQKKLKIEGIQFDYFKVAGLYLINTSETTINDSIVLHVQKGVWARWGTRIVCNRVEIAFDAPGPGSVPAGIQVLSQSAARLFDCNIHDLGTGISCGQLSTLELSSCTVDSCSSVGVFIFTSSYAAFLSTIPLTVLSNCSGVGVKSVFNSVTGAVPSNITFINTPTPVLLESGSVGN